MNWDQTHNFDIRKIECKDDYEGKVEACLISRKAGDSSKKALLYLHGFVDYFFHDKFANWVNSIEINFYALDLRKYGRSLMTHQKPNNFRDYKEYFEEIDKAYEIIKQDGNNEIILYGHSTGGLIMSLYAHHRKENKEIKALILNSPFFEINTPSAMKALLPFITTLAKYFPNIASPEGLKDGYAISLHKDYEGEWDFNLDWKPILGYGLNLGWIRAIYRAQKELQKGLDIECPILVMYSHKSHTPGKYHELMKESDAVLNVDDISKYAEVLGPNVKKVVIENGIHDLVLSSKIVRQKVYAEMDTFIRENGFMN